MSEDDKKPLTDEEKAARQAAYERKSYKKRQEHRRQNTKLGRPLKNQYVEPTFDKIAIRAITPDIERELFPYFAAGMSIRQIHQLFGKKYDFSKEALYNARNYYKWELRQTEIRNKILNDNNEVIVKRFKEYVDFVDEVIDESMQRFRAHRANPDADEGRGAVRIMDMKDLKTALESITHILHGGVQKHEIKEVKPIDDTKAAQILEILSGDANMIEVEAEKVEFDESDTEDSGD